MVWRINEIFILIFFKIDYFQFWLLFDLICAFLLLVSMENIFSIKQARTTTISLLLVRYLIYLIYQIYDISDISDIWYIRYIRYMIYHVSDISDIWYIRYIRYIMYQIYQIYDCRVTLKRSHLKLRLTNEWTKVSFI